MSLKGGKGKRKVEGVAKDQLGRDLKGELGEIRNNGKLGKRKEEQEGLASPDFET